MADDGDGKLGAARKKAKKLGLGTPTYTLIVCMDTKSAKCCSAKRMKDTWRQLKLRSREWRKDGNRPVVKIKSSCIGVCKAGPLVGVLPDGVWYGNCRPEVIDRIFNEHLADGQVLEEFRIAGQSP